MKCIKCQSKNRNYANYCKNCGYHFSKEEQEAASKWSLPWFLEKIDNFKKLITLDILKGNIIYRILSIIVVLFIGIYMIIVNGLNMKILPSDNYKIEFNKKEKEYYIINKEEETKLNLYLPNKIKEIKIILYDKNNNIIKETNYQKKDDIILNDNYDENYYVIESISNSKVEDKIKLYVYLQDNVEVSYEK